MQKIVPHLWYDKEANEAAEFYVSVFGDDSKIQNSSTLHDTPSGDAGIVSFQLWGFNFMAVSAGPYFKPNPSISIMVNFDPSRMTDAEARLDDMWQKLSDGGSVLMELQEYPFSKRYGWLADKYGFSWQLILTDPGGEDRPLIVPSLLFVTETGEIAEEASNFYMTIFKNTKRGTLVRYPPGPPAGGGPNKEGAVMFTDFQLAGQWFAAMDGSTKMHKFKFNEAVSLLVNCDTQKEIDYYWQKLSAVPESEQCGWLKDKYGLSWQISPTALRDMLLKGTREQMDRVTKAFLKMKKFDIAQLQAAYGE